MAHTVKEAFEKFNNNLGITGLQRSTVSIRQREVRSTIENGMDVLDSFLTGSYCRHTMITPLKEADIDIFVVLDPLHYSIKQQFFCKFTFHLFYITRSYLNKQHQ